MWVRIDLSVRGRKWLLVPRPAIYALLVSLRVTVSVLAMGTSLACTGTICILLQLETIL